MKEKLPSLSIIVVTLNCERYIGECLSRIIQQDYPKDLMEILIMDGGSTDRTKEIVKKFPVELINGGAKRNAEVRKSMAIRIARNEILFYIDADNYILEKDWLRKMVKPFMEHGDIVATYTLRYAYVKDETLLNRYYGLFGVGDPVAFYLRKADRLSWFEDDHDLRGKILEEKETYYKVKFTPATLPTVGCNGFLIRKDILKERNCPDNDFFHTDVNYDLVKMGYDKYAIVKSVIFHKIADSLIKLIKRRIHYMEIYYEELGKFRRYKLFNHKNKNDIINLTKFILYSLTFIKPFYDSLKGYAKIRDRAWFIHPFICIIFLFAYTYGIISAKLKNM